MIKRNLVLAAGLLGALSLTAPIGHTRGDGGWHAGYGQAYGHGNSWRHGRRALRKLRRVDADEDGKVTLEEFVIRSRTRFLELDADGNAELSAEELTKPMREQADYKVRLLMKTYDADGDGKITQDEFAAKSRKRFATRDFNGDGKISDDELPPRRQKNKSKHYGGDASAPGDAASAAQHGKGPKHAGQYRGGRHGKYGRGQRHQVRSIEKVLEYSGRRFARYDTNADGVIEASEILDRGRERRVYYQRRRLHVLDANKDGTISSDEFLAGPKERFAVMDLDDDGAITADDLPPRMARRWKVKTSK